MYIFTLLSTWFIPLELGCVGYAVFPHFLLQLSLLISFKQYFFKFYNVVKIFFNFFFKSLFLLIIWCVWVLKFAIPISASHFIFSKTFVYISAAILIKTSCLILFLVATSVSILLRFLQNSASCCVNFKLVNVLNYELICEATDHST